MTRPLVGQLALPGIGPRAFQRVTDRVVGESGLTVAELRDAGIARVVEAADRADAGWRGRMLEAVARTCRELPDFICDDVWERADAEDVDFPRARAFGAVLQRAARLGYCRRTGEGRPSKRSHLSPKPVWRSLLYAGGAA